MFRIDHSTAAPAMPVAADPGAPGFFTGGNPLTSTPATVMTAEWANIVQEELMAPVLAAGLTPDKGNSSQLLEAIRTLAVPDDSGIQGDPSAGHLAIVMPGMLAIKFMLQWGSTSLGGGGSNVMTVPFSFPTPFRSTPIAIVGNADGPANNRWHPINVCFPDFNYAGATIVADTANKDERISAGRAVRWIAIGVSGLDLPS